MADNTQSHLCVGYWQTCLHRQSNMNLMPCEPRRGELNKLLCYCHGRGCGRHRYWQMGVLLGEHTFHRRCRNGRWRVRQLCSLARGSAAPLWRRFLYSSQRTYNVRFRRYAVVHIGVRSGKGKDLTMLSAVCRIVGVNDSHCTEIASEKPPHSHLPALRVDTAMSGHDKSSTLHESL